MKKVGFLLLIVLLVGCSDKKTPPEQTSHTAAEEEIPDLPEEIAYEEWEDEEAEEETDGPWVNPILNDYYIKDVQASSELSNSQGTYFASNLTDRTWHSWAEGSDGDGTGESFTFHLKSII